MANLGLYIYCSVAHQSKFELLMIPCQVLFMLIFRREGINVHLIL